MFTSIVLGIVMVGAKALPIPQGHAIAFSAMVASAAINFLDIGVGVATKSIAHNELLRREHALIIDGSHQINAYLDLNRSYDKLAAEVKRALIAGTILTCFSIRHLAQYGDESTLFDILAGLASMVLSTDEVYQPDVESDKPSWVDNVVDWFIQTFYLH